MTFPTTREEAIKIIDEAGRREEFEIGWNYNLEDYFDEQEEPEIWFSLFDDLEIVVEPPTTVSLAALIHEANDNHDWKRIIVLCDIGNLFIPMECPSA